MKWNTWWLGVGLILLLLGAFSLGRDMQTSLTKVYQPVPTPKSEKQFRIGQMVKVDNLELTVQDAWRIARPNEDRDLGILTVKFKGGSDCYDEENLNSCTFRTGNFQLVDKDGDVQPVSIAPTKYIDGMRIMALAPIRDLIPSTEEEGQVYWLLEKESNEFILVYKSVSGGDDAMIQLQPKTFTVSDVQMNLMTTTQPVYRLRETGE